MNFTVTVLMFMVCLFVGAITGYVNGVKDTREEATKKKKGEYYIDNNNKKAFRWK